jgi:peptidoglycan biosynthesis protein MviN/MurJ (putative lipid II flippase)
LWAIISTVIWWIIMLFLSTKEIKKQNIQINIDWKFILKNLILASILWAILWFTAQNIQFEDRLKVFLWIFGVWLIYLLVILWVNYESVKVFVKEVKRNLKK